MQKVSAFAVQANRGRALEELLEASFNGAGPDVKMFPQANRWVPLRGGKKAYPSRGSPVDFVGVLKGVPVAVEAKETNSSRLPVNKSRFLPKELLALTEFERAGGRAFVVAAFWKKELLAVYTMETLLAAAGFRRSLKPEEADVVLPLDRAPDLPKKLYELCVD